MITFCISISSTVKYKCLDTTVAQVQGVIESDDKELPLRLQLHITGLKTEPGFCENLTNVCKNNFSPHSRHSTWCVLTCVCTLTEH